MPFYIVHVFKECYDDYDGISFPGTICYKLCTSDDKETVRKWASTVYDPLKYGNYTPSIHITEIKHPLKLDKYDQKLEKVFSTRKMLEELEKERDGLIHENCNKLEHIENEFEKKKEELDNEDSNIREDYKQKIEKLKKELISFGSLISD